MNHTLIIIILLAAQDPRNAPCVNGNCPIQNPNQNNQQINLPLRARDDTIGASRLDFKYIDQQVHSLKPA